MDEINPARDAAFLGSKQFCGFFADFARLIGTKDRLIESAPAEGRACLNDLVEAAAVRLAQRNCLLGPQVVAHDLGQQLPPAPDLGRETLTDDIANAVRQPKTHLPLFV